MFVEEITAWLEIKLNKLFKSDSTSEYSPVAPPLSSALSPSVPSTWPSPPRMYLSNTIQVVSLIPSYVQQMCPVMLCWLWDMALTLPIQTDQESISPLRTLGARAGVRTVLLGLRWMPRIIPTDMVSVACSTKMSWQLLTSRTFLEFSQNNRLSDNTCFIEC